MELLEVESHVLTSRDGVRIVYYEGGNPEGQPIILSNGLGGNIEAWNDLVHYFSEKYRIVSWDYRGLYQSGPSDDMGGYALLRHVEDLEDLVEHLGLTDYLLIGWSMGCQVNFEFCRTHADAVAGLIAINGTTGRPFHTFVGRKTIDDVIEQVLPPVLGIAQRHWEKVAFVGPAVAESSLALRALQAIGVIGSTANLEIFQRLARGFVSLDFGIYTQILEELGAHDATDVAMNLELPLLLIAGEKDPLTPSGAFQVLDAHLEHAELTIIPGATHYSPIEFPELVNLRIEKFIREKVPGHR